MLHQLVSLCTIKVTSKVFKFGRNRSKSRDPLDSGGGNCFFVREVSVAFSKQDARRGREVAIDEAGKVNGYDVKWIKGRRGSGGWTVARAPPAGTDHVAAVKAEYIGARVRLKGGATFENVGRKAEVESSEDMRSMVQHVLEQSTGWALLYRQTAPFRWPRGVDVLHRSDPTSPNYARLDARTIDELRDEGGALTLRMQWYKKGKRKPAFSNLWRQTSDPLQPGRAVQGYEPLRIQRGDERFGGLRGSKSGLHQLAQGVVGGRDALFVVGQHQMNRWGGLTSCELGRKATRWRVELYALMPESESARRLAHSREESARSARSEAAAGVKGEDVHASGDGSSRGPSPSPDKESDRGSGDGGSGALSERTPGGKRPPSPPSPLTKLSRGTAAVRRTSIVAARMLQVERTPSEVERERQAAEDKALSENLGLGGRERKQIERQFRRRKAVFKLRQLVNARYNSQGANPLFAERDYIYEAPEMRAARRLHSNRGPRRRRASVSDFLRYRLSHSNPRIPLGYLPKGRRDALRESMRGVGAAEAGVWLASVEISPSQIMLQDGPGNMGFFVQVGGPPQPNPTRSSRPKLTPPTCAPAEPLGHTPRCAPWAPHPHGTTHLAGGRQLSVRARAAHLPPRAPRAALVAPRLHRAAGGAGLPRLVLALPR